ILRLALIYALLDRDDVIRFIHLQAAVAIWEYCLASAKLIFSSAIESVSVTVGNSINEQILSLLKSGEKTRNDLTMALKNRAKSKEIAQALATLQDLGKVEQRREKTKGAPKDIWSLRQS
ncbi:MAG: hypothetical protein K2X27_06725, partial [Candidatus Obscuribacterales bacterium]|nr:hypothetical protein [Candidatus Obscuribacterales bacterium]